MASLAEWREQARRGTSGDMVWPILEDWEKSEKQWITHRVPRKDELEKAYQHDGYVTYMRTFLTWNGTLRIVNRFMLLTRSEEDGDGYCCGYWETKGVVAWMTFPDPPE